MAHFEVFHDGEICQTALMHYTLKLDWPASRTEAVVRLLEVAPRSTPGLDAMLDDLDLYRADDATLKLNWPHDWIQALVDLLMLNKPTDSEVGLSEASLAAADIIEYRAAVKAVSNDED